MRTVCRTVACLLAAAILVSTAGCPQVDDRTNNQGGSDLVSLGTKLANNDLRSMNPDDWQVLTDNLARFAALLGIDTEGITLPQMTDEEAAALDAFLEANGVATIEDLDALLQRIEAGEVEIPEALANWANELANLFA